MSYPGPDNPYGQQPQNQPDPQLPQYPQHPQGAPYPQNAPYPPNPQFAQYPPQYAGPAPGFQQRPPAPVYPYASWGARAGAAVIDFLIFTLVPLTLNLMGSIGVMRDFFDAIDACPAGDSACIEESYDPLAFYTEPLSLVGMILGLAGFVLMCYLEGRTGQTPGRKALGIKLIRERDGGPTGFGLAFGRRICHMVDGAACYIGYLWPLWDDKKQTFADKMVSTVVIRVRN